MMSKLFFVNLILGLAVFFTTCGCVRTTRVAIQHAPMQVRNHDSFRVTHNQRDYFGASPIVVEGASGRPTHHVNLDVTHRRGLSGDWGKKSYLWGSEPADFFLFVLSAGVIPSIITTSNHRDAIGYLKLDGFDQTNDLSLFALRMHEQRKRYEGWLFLPMLLFGFDVDKTDVSANRAALARELRNIPANRLEVFIP